MTTFMRDITPDKTHTIIDEGEELGITADRARALVEAGLIYVCEEHSGECDFTYHISPDHTWQEVDPR